MSVLLDAAQVLSLGPVGAVRAVRDALAAGVDPDADVPRAVLPLAAGQGLLMPSEAAGWFGVKVATVAPGNAARGLPRINATYLLYDSATLTPAAILDGVALTSLRTPAVSVAACLDRLRALAAAAAAAGGLRLVVFGAGPQAEWHVRTVRAHAAVADVTAVTRSGAAAAWADRAPAAADPAVGDHVRAADVIVTATSARQPVLDGRLVRDTALVLAVGSHEPSVRELDGALMERATVVVESRATALREAGDVVLAVAEHRLSPDALLPMSALLAPGAPPLPAGRPAVVKTTGMAWEDLAVAAAAYRHHTAS